MQKMLFPALLLLAAASSARAEESEQIRRGEAIYRAQCQSCHGTEGQGTEESYPDPLIGDSSIVELADLISETMPEEDAETCVGQDATAVAAFIHHQFYGAAAQARRRSPRVALARLTAEQLRQSLADLYASFGDSPWTESKRGLQAIYFDGARWKNENKKIERIDPVLQFDFGHDGPGEGINAKDFYIHWSGSLLVERTGTYELILRSSCSCTMDFGANDRELINNHVQSEGKEEFRRSMQLTAGRAYPLEIDFFQRKRKTEQPPAKISLSWIAPGGQEETIPARHLVPSTLPATFALQTKLPPDDRSYGYERGIAIDRAWDDSTTNAAIEFAQIAISELYPRYRRRHRKDSDENRALLRAFLRELVETAFRGPLDEATQSLYIDRQVEQCEDDGEAIKRVILVALKSPRFLYPTLDGQVSNSRRAANRLALTLFDSLPTDDWLVKLADTGGLESKQQIKQAAWRMFDDRRARAKTRGMLDQWLDLAEIDEITKDQDAYAGFDPALVADLRKSVDAFIDGVVWSDSSDFRQLLQADWMYTTDRIADFYGEPWQAEQDAELAESAASEGEVDEGEANELRRSVSDPQVHVGLLTHPLLMSRLAYHKTSSPIHRGVFLTRHVLGRVLLPPNAAFTPLNPELHPDLTTRQRVDLQTGEESCQVCHQKINPLGFALESFDATGRFRSTENGKPIDSRGRYVNRQGEAIPFEGARQLGDFLAQSTDCHRALVEAAFEHFVKQPIAAYGEDLSDRLTESFRESGFSIRHLIVSIAVVAAEHSDVAAAET